MNLNVYTKDFLNYITVEKWQAKNTILAYGRDLIRFENFLLAKQVINIANVDFSLLYDFLKSMCDEGLSPATRRRHLGCLKTFFRFLKREGFIEKNFVQYVESPTLWQELPEILSVTQMAMFLDTPHEKNRANDMRLRNKAILEVLYGSGLRISELIEAKVVDIDDDGNIKIMGKGSRQRIVPMTNNSHIAIEAYWSQKRSSLNPTDYIFTTFRGKKTDRVELFRMIKRHAENCGIKKEISPHTFRHSFATHLLDNGCDLAVLKDMLGHESVGTTGRYLHLTSTKLKQNFDKYHPRNDRNSLETPNLRFA